MKKIVFLLLFVGIGAVCLGQRKPPKLPKFNKTRDKDVFLEKQWFLGFKGGVNLSEARPYNSYAVIHPIGQDPYNKEYTSFQYVGTQAALEATFYFTGLSLSFQPTYRYNRFSYENTFTWADAENPTNRIDVTYNQQQQVHYLDLPLLAKYEYMISKFSPYIQAGVYYSFLVNANKSVLINGTDYASGGTDQFVNGPLIVGATDLFAPRHWGLVYGIGTYMNQGNVRFCLDIQFKQGLSNISSVVNRFKSDRLSGIGDTMDDMRLNSVAVSIGCLFPLRFLSSSFRSIDRPN